MDLSINNTRETGKLFEESLILNPCIDELISSVKYYQ